MAAEVEATHHFHPKEVARTSDASQDELSTSAGGSDDEDVALQDSLTQMPEASQQNVGRSAATQVISSEQAVLLYSRHFAEQALESDRANFTKASLPWRVTPPHAQDSLVPVAEDVKLAFAKDLEDPHFENVQGCHDCCRLKAMAGTSEFKAKEHCETKESDCDICQKCRLPLGDIRYDHPSGKPEWGQLHGECMAQVMADELQQEQQAKKAKDAQEKQKQREVYGLGWKRDHIPRNTVAASKLEMRDIPQGMVCLVLGDDGRTADVASTLDPAASINLEYLSTALQVRRKAGHEPMFSLDPLLSTSDEGIENTMQAKVFVPDWLAGTAVGDVLFQADYHLKELSMGEHSQPIVGMKSCFDFSAEGRMQEWSAREWFLVRKAEMQITANNALIPWVKMGVEAREQVMNGSSLEDKTITQPDHPMVKYAEAFTRNFDLIAERKSVIFHLRELAKASVAAKFLLDSKISVQEHWFDLFIVKGVPYSLEVPQLWNDKLHGEVLVEDGSITRRSAALDGRGSRVFRVYGGVKFGLSKFSLTGKLSQAPPMMSSHSPANGEARLVASRSASTNVAAGRLAAPSPSAASGTIVPISSGSMHPKLTSLKPLDKLAISGSTMAKLSGLLPGKMVAPAAAQLCLNAGVSRQLSLASPGQIKNAAYSAAAMCSTDVVQPLKVAPPKASIGAVAAVSKPRLTVDALSATLASPRLSAHISAPALPPGARPILAEFPRSETSLQGVDLRLDNFDLREAKVISAEEHGGDWNSPIEALDKCVSMGDAFWSSLEDDSKKAFTEADRTLLGSIFHPTLSDRRHEGDSFCPPDARLSYVTKLRALVQEEDCIRQEREQHFFSTKFMTSDPGDLFPSWAPSVTALSSDSHPIYEFTNQHLLVRPDYKQHASDLVESILRTSSPIFDRTTEEGTHFRIYRRGCLEVRTTQAAGFAEKVGVVFSVRDSAQSCDEDLTIDDRDSVQENERIARVTEYVERTSGATGNVSADCRYYLVVETQSGHKISTERLLNGAVTWNEDPPGLHDRNACAKILRSSQCRLDATVGDIKEYRSSVAKGASQAGDASPSTCKRYTHTAFARVVGAASKQVGGAPWWMQIARKQVQGVVGQ